MDFGTVGTLSVFTSKLEQGMVFRLKGDVPFASNDYHVFIVLNANPDTGEVLYLVNGSTQYQSITARLGAQGIDYNATTVAIFAGTYDFFSKDTIINCNSVHRVNISEINFDGDNVNLIYNQLNQDDLERIIAAVKESPLVAPYVKGLI